MSQALSPGAKKKAHAFVTADEVQPLIQQLVGRGFSHRQIAEMIGYTASSLKESKYSKGVNVMIYPLRLKMALLGVLAQLGDTTAHSLVGSQDKPFSLDFDEAVNLFDACRLAKKAFPTRAGQYKSLIGRLSEEITRLSR